MTPDSLSDPAQIDDFYAHVFNELTEAVIGVDGGSRIVFCNNAVETIFGWRPEELIGQPLEILIPERFRQAHGAHFDRFRESGGQAIYMGQTRSSVRGTRRNGEEIHLGTTIKRLETGRTGTMFIAVVRDITERIAYLREIERLANTESLTGLLNRRRFFEDLEALCVDNGAEGRIWLGILDLDGFKAINDIYGHQTGDAVLRRVADILRQSLPDTALAARIGGDEFALALPGNYASEDADRIGCQIIDAVRQIRDVDGSQVAIGASAGFARFPDMADSVHALYERADFSLYLAKKARSGGITIYSPSYEAKIDRRARIEHQLRACDLESELYLDYQPIIDLKRNVVTHFEALARWRSPELGLVPPTMFIAAAERCGKIRDITRILFSRALAEASRWPEGVSLSFNLSAQDILSPDSVFQLLQMILKCGLAPSRIELEITETSILTDFEQANTALKSLSMCGCKLSLDDFGNGYSSYGYIDRLPLHKIKMDRSFVSRLSGGNNPLKIIRAIADFAASMGLECVAEGVETRSQLEKVRAAGVPLAQGYLFSRPMPPEAIGGFLATGLAVAQRGRKMAAG